MISVVCTSDSRLHLAAEDRRMGASAFTLCLERWTDREPAREDSELCPKCIARWAEEQPKEGK